MADQLGPLDINDCVTKATAVPLQSDTELARQKRQTVIDIVLKDLALSSAGKEDVVDLLPSPSRNQLCPELPATLGRTITENTTADKREEGERPSYCINMLSEIGVQPPPDRCRNATSRLDQPMKL